VDADSLWRSLVPRRTQHLQRSNEVGPGRRTRLSGPPRCNTIQRRCGACWPRLRVSGGARETEDLVKLLHPHFGIAIVACQMTAAVFDQTAIEIDAGPVGLRATGQVMRFAGYLAIYAEAEEGASPDEETDGSLPDVHQDEIPAPARLPAGARHFTQPPPRYSEGDPGARLEEKGIAGPIDLSPPSCPRFKRNRGGYVEKKEGRLGPNRAGGACMSRYETESLAVFKSPGGDSK